MGPDLSIVHSSSGTHILMESYERLLVGTHNECLSSLELLVCTYFSTGDLRPGLTVSCHQRNNHRGPRRRAKYSLSSSGLPRSFRAICNRATEGRTFHGHPKLILYQKSLLNHSVSGIPVKGSFPLGRRHASNAAALSTYIV